jgi:hypothetical protein
MVPERHGQFRPDLAQRAGNENFFHIKQFRPVLSIAPKWRLSYVD